MKGFGRTGGHNYKKVIFICCEQLKTSSKRLFEFTDIMTLSVNEMADTLFVFWSYDADLYSH